jgi:hypothetical protein
MAFLAHSHYVPGGREVEGRGMKIWVLQLAMVWTSRKTLAVGLSE